MWIYYYSKEMVPSTIADLILCGKSKRNRAIIVARTYHEGYFLPGYAVDGVGYFVSKERQPFQTSNIDVLVETNIEFAEYPFNFEKGMVAMDSLDESKEIKIGSFIIDGMRLCGMVDDQNTCHINYKDKLYSKEAPEFQIPVVTVDTEDPEYDGPSSDEENDEFAIQTIFVKFMKGQVETFCFHAPSSARDGFIERADKMPTWINYRPEYLMSRRTDAVFCGCTHTKCKIYVARTLFEGYHIPGNAINGIGYFVTNAYETLKTYDFQVLVDINTSWVEYRGNDQNGMVADDGVVQSNRIKIGRFLIDGMPFCGMVDDNNTCCVSFFNQLGTKNAPGFEVLVELTPNGGIRIRNF